MYVAVDVGDVLFDTEADRVHSWVDAHIVSKFTEKVKFTVLAQNLSQL